MAERRDQRLVAIGVIRRAHGLAGEVRVAAYDEESTLLGEVDEVVLRGRGGDVRALGVATSRVVPGAFLIALQGVVDRDSAEALAGLEVCVPRDRLPEPAPGEYYHVDLVGLAVHGPDGTRVGEVVRVERSPAHDLLVVAGPRGERLIPIADVAVRGIDLESGRVDLEGWDEYEE